MGIDMDFVSDGKLRIFNMQRYCWYKFLPGTFAYFCILEVVGTYNRCLSYGDIQVTSCQNLL